MIVAGIDYSISCPAICVHSGDSWNPENCKFIYITSTKKYQGEYLDGRLVGYCRPIKKYFVQEHSARAHIVLNFLQSERCTDILIEGYSYSSTGKVFNLAENAGILKLLLANNKMRFDEASPSEAKKFATGKGNANKEMMVDAFIVDYGTDLSQVLGMTNPNTSPMNDLADAYFHCKLLHTKRKSNEDSATNVAT